MFVRFRQARRLQVSLIETRRVAGKVQHEHVAGLGAIDIPPSVADRIAFWQGLHERLGKLSNRVDAATQAKILGDVHARIPMVTIAEQRALQLENAEADERFWESLRDMHQATVDDNKGLAAIVEHTIAATQAGAEMAGTKAEAAKDRVVRLKKGEAVSGGLGQPLTQEDFRRALRDAGWTTKDIERARIVATIGDLGGFDEMMDEIHKSRKRAERSAIRTVLRRRLRAAPAPAS